MLVVSRKKNEGIIINGDITLTVVEIRGDKVRLGIVCPRTVPVHRQEVFEAIHGPRAQVPTQAAEAAPRSGPSAPQAPLIEVSVDQLINDLGAAEADVPHIVHFTNEGGIRPR